MAIKINLDHQKERKFREHAMKKFGYKKGALTKALEEAIDMWLLAEKSELSPIKRPTQELEGLLSEITETSVELQHFGSKLLLKNKGS